MTVVKHFRIFMRKLIICLIIKEILQGNLSIEQAHALIDAVSEARRFEKIKKKEEQRIKQISQMNNQFLSITQRFRNGTTNKTDSNTYKSYFSVD